MAQSVTRQRPDPDDLPQAGINFGGVGSGTLLVLATEDGQPIVLPGPNRDLPPPGLPLMEGIDAVKAGVERDIRTASITTTDGDETITTPIRVLTEGATLQGQPIFFQVVGDRTTEVRTLSVLVIVLIVGGVVARRTPRRTRAERGATAPAAGAGTTKAVSGRKPAGPAAQQRQAPAQDDDMAEIEALLKSRGID